MAFCEPKSRVTISTRVPGYFSATSAATSCTRARVRDARMRRPGAWEARLRTVAEPIPFGLTPVTKTGRNPDDQPHASAKRKTVAMGLTRLPPDLLRKHAGNLGPRSPLAKLGVRSHCSCRNFCSVVAQRCQRTDGCPPLLARCMSDAAPFIKERRARQAIHFPPKYPPVGSNTIISLPFPCPATPHPGRSMASECSWRQVLGLGAACRLPRMLFCRALQIPGTTGHAEMLPRCWPKLGPKHPSAGARQFQRLAAVFLSCRFASCTFRFRLLLLPFFFSIPSLPQLIAEPKMSRRQLRAWDFTSSTVQRTPFLLP